MRRRLFWTIAAVAALSGFVVLVAGALASQRAAVNATYREMAHSSAEVVAVVEESLSALGGRPDAVRQLFGLGTERSTGPLLGRIRRTAGSSQLVFGAVVDGMLAAGSDDLFEAIPLEVVTLIGGEPQFARSEDDELVVVTPITIMTRAGEATFLVGLARDAPVVRPADQMRGLIPIAIGVALISAVLARLLSTQLSDRLVPLVKASHRIAKGDLTARVADLMDEELGDVARAFNDMAGALQASQDREREFILGVGHDLRTPLTTIRGYAEALEGDEVDAGDLSRVGSVLGAQARQLGRLIEDLTLLARLAQPEFDLRPEIVDVGAHVTEVAESMRRRAEAHGLKLSIVAVEGLTVSTDPDRLAQITQNLVENALRFTPEPGSIEVSVAPTSDGVEIVVADSGIGIPAEDLPRVFDRHFTRGSRRVRDEGSGLGLSIVQSLVVRMGGEVVAESSPGHGTTVRVFLGPGT